MKRKRRLPPGSLEARVRFGGKPMVDFVKAFDAITACLPGERGIDKKIEEVGKREALKFYMMRVFQKESTTAADVDAIALAAETLRADGDKSLLSKWKR